MSLTPNMQCGSCARVMPCVSDGYGALYCLDCLKAVLTKTKLKVLKLEKLIARFRA